METQMDKTKFEKKYRQFLVYPFKDNGIVVHVDNKSNEFVDKNGYRFIKDSKGVKHPISHIIWAVGFSVKYGHCKSYQWMKNVIIKYKDGNKLNCNFENLDCIIKKKYKEKLKRDNELSEYWQ